MKMYFHFHANQTYFDMEGFARGFDLKQKQKVVTRKGYMYNALTNPSMKMRGHNTLETPLVSPFVFTALGSTLGKIVGIRQTKRPTTTARPQSSFRSVGLFRKMRTLWKNNNRKQNRHRHCDTAVDCFPKRLSVRACEMLPLCSLFISSSRRFVKGSF